LLIGLLIANSLHTTLNFAIARIVNIVVHETTLLFDSMDRGSLIRQFRCDRQGFPELPCGSGIY
jgi:hypothetical protein